MAIEVHRIRKELDRIKTLRSSFASTPENDNAMRRFNWYRANWKLHALNKCPENLENLDDRVKKMDLEIHDHSRRVEWERRILHKVQEWPQDGIPPKPKSPEEEGKEQEDKEEAERKASQRKKRKKKKKRTEPAKESRNCPEDSYGLTVSQITLRRSDPACTSSFMSYDMKQPSLNDCLFKKKNNPLTKPCEDNTIRHFHIPANNMHWIEMPYLHWESHKKRKKMSEEIQKITQKHLETQVHVTEDMKREFIKMSDQIRIQHARAMTFHNPNQPKSKGKEDEKEKKKPAKPLTPGPLGWYLLNIAKLYDAMDVEPDVRVLRDHLFQDPPLHTRRNLDQSYYWKLPNTDGRDQDQVVYRGTKEGKHISRTTRVVMVDQLWMYILDDISLGGGAGTSQITLVSIKEFALVLTISELAKSIFFDLTKPVDERPEVLDIFSNALSHVSGMKTVAYETFWRHLDKLNATDRQLADFEVTARSYLNINPEGELLKEVHDIIEELRMMSRIYTQQLHVLEDFSRHLENMHQQDEKNAPKKLVDVMLEIKNLLGPRIAPHSAEDPLAAQHNQSPAQNGTARLITNGTPSSEDAAANASSISESTVEFAKRVCSNVTLRREQLQDLEESSIGVSDQLRDLLSLKQQQASIIEAKLALKRADESVIQGRSIMLFTIVTIIFLPLSFMTSVFGMNASEFETPTGGNSMSLKHQFKLICPNLSRRNRRRHLSRLLPLDPHHNRFVTHITFATIIEYTYVRRIWCWCIGKHTPDGLYEKREGLRREREAAKVGGVEDGEGEPGNVEGMGCFGGFARRRKTGEGNGVLPV
ncbi:hypothetical protein BKA61DRAFT_714014 [Leptodontidium sp. MPI-SDFR-AT-0119]|nr:hypothetical protein BKA61DRAFT_714014 [Leptodontidium sp. MPI-SDFR-AT-0119]